MIKLHDHQLRVIDKLNKHQRGQVIVPTMWRAVNRLERQGIVEVEKKDEQNIVKLTSKLEDPDE